MAELHNLPPRRHIRFTPDPLSVAFLDFHSKNEDFSPAVSALILEEAPLGGCGLVVKRFDQLAENLCVRVKVGELAPLHGIIRSVRTIEFGLARVGIEFLE